VVGIADPQALADAALALLTDAEAWHKAAAAGVARVERYYTHPVMFGRYRSVYDQALAGPTVAGSFATCPVPSARQTRKADADADDLDGDLDGELIDELMQEQGDDQAAPIDVDIKL
jgi:hypothetical protein